MLLLAFGDFVADPRAEILWLAIRRRFLDDRDLHEFTPIGLIDWGTSTSERNKIVDARLEFVLD